MAQLEYNGFVSTKRVLANAIWHFIIIAAVNISALFVGDILLNLLLTGILVVFLPVISYVINPVVYQRVVINAEGIKCGKNHVKFSDVKDVKIVKGYIQCGNTLIADILPFKQSFDVYVGEIICFNCICDASVYLKKGDVYVYRCKGSEKALMAYCDKYKQVLASAYV